MDFIHQKSSISNFAIEELGVSEEVESALRSADIRTLGQLKSKSHLEEKGIAADAITCICMALHQFGTMLQT